MALGLHSIETGASATKAAGQCWSDRYGEKHRLRRIVTFPVGIAAPKKVRIYYRHDHYVLQWWDPKAGGNRSDRIDGDLVAAIARARTVEEQLEQRRSTGPGRARLGHGDLVHRFLADLDLRANAGEIDPGTARRYRSALQHFITFVHDTDIGRSFPFAASINREFALKFAAFLQNRHIAPNGHPSTRRRPMRGQAFVEAAFRAMLGWAADPERGNLLPETFRVPLCRNGRRRAASFGQIGEPDISMDMAVQFVGACDTYQLTLFAPLMLFGLRASEPCLLFREFVADGWLQVPCLPQLAYETKGRRDKAFPVIDSMRLLWAPLLAAQDHGLLYRRRPRGERQTPRLLDSSLAHLVKEFERRCASASTNAAEKVRLRNELLREAGGISYDDIEAEFAQIAKRLDWPAQATLKDFRHLFCTSLENAGVPESYRKYLMGHAPGSAPIATYTHLNQVAQHYEMAMSKEFQPLIAAIRARALGNAAAADAQPPTDGR